MTIRVFLSSPSDVEPERDAVTRVVDRINLGQPSDSRFELIRWEDEFYTADSTFQDQITKPSDCDLVLCIFWKRLGSDLPEKYRRADGTLPTGSEFEFEMALNHSATAPDRLPDVLVYRKTADVFFSEEDLDVEQQQRERFLSFWQRWFRNEKGHFVAGFHSFEDSEAFEAQVESHLRRWLAQRMGQVSWTRGSPFRGLRAFDIGDAEIFFGRRRETDRARARVLANTLSGKPFLLIHGASGSGKSSLARAGVLPQLRVAGGIGGLPLLDRYALISPAQIRATGNWAQGLASSLFAQEALAAELMQGDFSDPEALASLFKQGGSVAVAPIARALQRTVDEGGPTTARGLILLIDQFEELFDWPRPEADAFLTWIEAAMTAGVHVLATMRSEYLHRVGDHEALARLTAVHAVQGPDAAIPLLDIEAPGAADLRDIILGPARAAGLTYEAASGTHPDLSTRIERDAVRDALPALQLLLSELYERREGGMMTHAAYDELGGVTGVMAHRGDAVLDEVDVATRAAFPDLARSFVQIGHRDLPARARRVPHDRFGDGPDGELAERLRDAGLITSDADGMRLAHESLIQGWQRLAEFIAEERHFFEIRDRLSRLCDNYTRRKTTSPDEAKDALLQGRNLIEGQELLAAWGADSLREQSPELPNMIAASQRQETHRQRRRVFGFGSVAAGAVAALVVFAWLQVERGRAQLEARLQASMAEAAQFALQTGNWSRALEAAAEALALRETAQTRSMAWNAASEHSSPHLVGYQQGSVQAVGYDPSGIFAQLREDGELLVGETPLSLPPLGGPGQSYRRVMPFADHVLVVTSEGWVGRLQRDGGEIGWLVQDPRFPALHHQIGLFSDGSRFSVAVVDSSPQNGVLLICASTELCENHALPPAVAAASFSPDGQKLAFVTADEFVILDLTGPEPLEQSRRDHGVLPRSLAWLDGQTLAIGTGDNALMIESVSDDTAPLRIDSALPPMVMAPSPDGQFLGYSCAVDALCLLDLTVVAPLRPKLLYRLPSAVRDLTWSPEGELLSLHHDGSLLRWSPQPNLSVISQRSVSRTDLTTLSVGSDGQVAVGDRAGGVYLLHSDRSDLQVLRMPTRDDTPDRDVVHLAWNGEGKLAAATRDRRLLRVDTTNGTTEQVEIAPVPERLSWIDQGKAIAVSSARDILVWPDQSSPHAITIQLGDQTQTIGAVLDLPMSDKRLGFSLNSGALLAHAPDDTIAPLVPMTESADRLSALSLDLSPDQRWLAASRADAEVRLFDLTRAVGPVTLSLLTPDSKVVRFSPNGDRVAVLGSDGVLSVWKFETATGTAELYLRIEPVPEALRLPQSPNRAAQWIDWLSDDRIVVATSAGDILTLDIAWSRIAEYVASKAALEQAVRP